RPGVVAGSPRAVAARGQTDCRTGPPAQRPGRQQGQRVLPGIDQASTRSRAYREQVARAQGVVSSRDGVNRRSRRLLLTTNTELKAIAAPAIIGSSRPSAASGIAAAL